MKTSKVLAMVATTILKVIVAAAIVVVVYKAAIIAYDFGFRIFSDDAISAGPGVTMSVAIVEGKSVSEIGKTLEEKGLIRNATLFYFQERFSEYHKKLKPGIYELSTSMTPFDMMKLMSAQAVEEDSEEESATVPEDQTTEEGQGAEGE